MLTIFTAIVDALFPPRPEALMVRNVSDTVVLQLYEEDLYAGVTYLSAYSTPLIRALIHENKYFKNRQAAQLLASLLRQWLTRQSSPLVLIPIPLSRTRYYERDYNQVSQIVEAVAKTSNVSVDESILERVVDTVSQTSLKRHDRLANMHSAFKCRTDCGSRYDNHTFVLIDDVVTTGATLQAARAALTEYFPDQRIICVALAH